MGIIPKTVKPKKMGVELGLVFNRDASGVAIYCYNREMGKKMNLANWLVKTAKQYPDAPALFSGQELRADYAEFARRSAAIGSYLQAEYGVTKGDRVALFLPNCTQYLELLYGIWFLGAVAVPINSKLHAKEAAWIIGDAGAMAVFSSEEYLARFGSDMPDCVIHTAAVDVDEFSQIYKTPPLSAPVHLQLEDLVWLFYTSGTTGKPKGVMLSSANITAMALSYFADLDEVYQEDAILYAAPMSHGAGIYNFMHVIRGARHVVPLSGGFDSDEILDLARELQDVSMFAAPTMVRRLVDCAKERSEDGDGLRTIVYGGGPMYVADIIEAVEIMGPRFVQVMGQGECPMAISALNRAQVSDRSHPNWRARLGSVGLAQSVVSVEIHGDDGQELGRGEVGEICVSGLPVMRGYWKNEEATDKTVVNGWLKTGDMGMMDANGFITLHDRSKDMVISGGSNIYPREVEEVLLEHPAVSEVSVIGKKDPEWGEIVVAYVVAKGVEASALDAHCLNQIARFKRPKLYRFVDDLPKNSYGKVLKTELRAHIENEA